MGLTLDGLYTVQQEETIKQHTSRTRDRERGGQLQDLPVLSSPSSLSSTITREMKTPWPSMSRKWLAYGIFFTLKTESCFAYIGIGVSCGCLQPINGFSHLKEHIKLMIQAFTTHARHCTSYTFPLCRRNYNKYLMTRSM